jgi:hypothetical protein
MNDGGLDSGWLGAGGVGAGGVGSDPLGSGQLDGERGMTGVGRAGGRGAGGAAAGAARSGAPLVAKLKPQSSQNWPDRAVPQLGHGSLSRSDWAGGDTGGRVAPGDGAASGQGAGAGIDSRIRIPHVSQKSVLSDS